MYLILPLLLIIFIASSQFEFLLDSFTLINSMPINVIHPVFPKLSIGKSTNLPSEWFDIKLIVIFFKLPFLKKILDPSFFEIYLIHHFLYHN